MEDLADAGLIDELIDDATALAEDIDDFAKQVASLQKSLQNSTSSLMDFQRLARLILSRAEAIASTIPTQRLEEL